MSGKRTVRFINIAVAFFGTWFIAHSVVVSAIGFTTNAAQIDVIVVFGNRVYEDLKPSRTLTERLDRTIEAAQAYPTVPIILTGGIEPEGVNEPAVMADYLIKAGVSSDRLIKDDQGMTTWESVAHLSALGIPDLNSKNVGVISQYFHMTRIEVAMHRFDFSHVTFLAADYRFRFRDIYSLLREYVGFYYYLFR